MQNGADALGFLILQIQDHLGLGVVYDALAVFAVLQRCLLYTSRCVEETDFLWLQGLDFWPNDFGKFAAGSWVLVNITI